MEKRLLSFAMGLLALAFTACEDDSPASMVDPLPMPSDFETYKDPSFDPGDSFFDYCNGAWLQSQPIPQAGAVGGLYDAQGPMDQRVEDLKASVPDIGHFYELIDNVHGNPEQTRAYIDAQKARFPRPTTREEAFLTLGRMMKENIAPWVRSLPSWNLQWKDGKLMAILYPPAVRPSLLAINSADVIPLSQTRADDTSAASLMIRGMGLDASQFVTAPALAAAWSKFENSTLEELCQIIDDAWESYDMFVSQERMEAFHLTKEYIATQSRYSLSYTLSYHLADQFISPADKERFVRITREIQASLRNRIQKVGWMSETTRINALEKLDNCGLYVAYPDQWHMDCVSTLTDCETLAEAVDRNNRGTARLMSELLGGNDAYSFLLIQQEQYGKQRIPLDLTLVNACYYPEFNGVFIYPAVLLPPVMPENVSDACAYAVYMIIGHEFTHGFDSNGAKFDKWGNKRNWWTVADQMAFEERCQTLIQCYNHMEMDSERAPGVYGNGDRTLSENIADLGGFLTALDAYQARLKMDGYTGQAYDNQLRKFFEYFAHLWSVQYSDAMLENFKTTDVHSPARLRVNGTLMNTDLWYRLYNVNRNHYLYLPPERRTYIW